jgi:hypothetical protein
VVWGAKLAEFVPCNARFGLVTAHIWRERQGARLGMAGSETRLFSERQFVLLIGYLAPSDRFQHGDMQWPQRRVPKSSTVDNNTPAKGWKSCTALLETL